MPTVRLTLPLYMPAWLHGSLRRVKRAIFPVEEIIVDLAGDRDIEWSFIASRLPMGPGEVFDFGCGYGNMSIHAVQKGHRVLALDLQPNRFAWFHPNLEIR